MDPKNHWTESQIWAQKIMAGFKQGFRKRGISPIKLAEIPHSAVGDDWIVDINSNTFYQEIVIYAFFIEGVVLMRDVLAN